ncbi:MAG: AIR synthase-related protein [Clostridia bacterium]|nr:AIR synthase-related protein [Clostridia bacterium]
MSVVVSKNDADKALSVLRAQGEEPYVIGTITEGSEKIRLH